MEKETVVFLVGPTACGKTDMAIQIAQHMDAEIVSADSVQIYEKLDIGSAKPTKKQLTQVRHHMIDILPLTCADFSASAYQQRAEQTIDHLHTRNKRALVTGGTGFYIQSLTDAMHFSFVGKDQAFRDTWQEREESDAGCAHRALAEIDSAAAAKLHPNDVQRVIRALEVEHITGVPMSRHQQHTRRQAGKYHMIMAGLTMPRAQLYERINLRVDHMMAEGWVEEVKAILAEGYSPALPALRTIGYKEIIAALRGEYTMEEAAERIKLATRHYAKRQWTWFRRDERIRWFDVTDYLNQEEMMQQILEHVSGRSSCGVL